MFKVLDGNRSVKDGRVKKIIASILKVGWVRNPIIVNENLEIIDGQGRFNALKNQNMPIEFIIDEGVGIDECREMNIHQTNWNTMDYIDSYATRGNENYINFKTLLNDFKGIGMQAVVYSVMGLGNQSSLQNGELICTDADVEMARERLDYLKSVKPFIDMVDGRTELLEVAIVFIYGFCEEVDVERLRHVFEKYSRNMPPIATLENALREIENIYNKKYKGKLANFVNEYREYARKIANDKRKTYRKVRIERKGLKKNQRRVF